MFAFLRNDRGCAILGNILKTILNCGDGAHFTRNWRVPWMSSLVGKGVDHANDFAIVSCFCEKIRPLQPHSTHTQNRAGNCGPLMMPCNQRPKSTGSFNKHRLYIHSENLWRKKWHFIPDSALVMLLCKTGKVRFDAQWIISLLSWAWKSDFWPLYLAMKSFLPFFWPWKKGVCLFTEHEKNWLLSQKYTKAFKIIILLGNFKSVSIFLCAMKWQKNLLCSNIVTLQRALFISSENLECP